ncbi:deoxyribodipyrimidine photo-lyase [Colwelliaceae bacterium 6441]
MVLWFRNDLRTHDNPALHHFLKQTSPKAMRKAFFFITEKQWLAHDWSAIKIDFIQRHAQALVDELAELSIDLQMVKLSDFSEQITFLKTYCDENNIEQVFANSELEYNEQQRDITCLEQGIPLTLFEADVIVPKGKVLNKTGEMFKVFTPFKKAWLRYVQAHGFEYLGKVSHNKTIEQRSQKDIKTKGLSSAWPLAKHYEADELPHFLQEKLSSYAKCRDIPSIKGTSGMSAYLSAGLISPRFVLTVLLNRYPDILIASDSPEFAWLNELIWREFYRHLMFHEQRLCKHQCFKEKYQSVIWPNDAQLFNAWCEGKTGYPLVDAAMRQLNQTGWMHNRLRMVVASFLTKHLLIDWRLGEKYFMQHLIDGDLAANNGGWQWAASTGCDAQPYFRIFNPIRQSERFDPNGQFIRRYLPELINLPDKYIHFPHQYIKENDLNVYCEAIVDHKSARLKALAFYK